MLMPVEHSPPQTRSQSRNNSKRRSRSLEPTLVVNQDLQTEKRIEMNTTTGIDVSTPLLLLAAPPTTTTAPQGQPSTTESNQGQNLFTASSQGTVTASSSILATPLNFSSVYSQASSSTVVPPTYPPSTIISNVTPSYVIPISSTSQIEVTPPTITHPFVNVASLQVNDQVMYPTPITLPSTQLLSSPAQNVVQQSNPPYFPPHAYANYQLSYQHISPPTNYPLYHPTYNSVYQNWLPYPNIPNQFQYPQHHLPHSNQNIPPQPLYGQVSQIPQIYNQQSNPSQPSLNVAQPSTSATSQQSTSNAYPSLFNLTQIPSCQSQPSLQPEIPKILHPLPEFDGDTLQWLFFYSQFTESTRKYQYSNLDNTSRLKSALKGKPLNDVKCFLNNPQNVDHIIRSLEFIYGRPELLLETVLNKIKNLRAVNENSTDRIIPMSIEVQQIVCIFEQMPNSQQHMSNPIVLRDLVNKLPLSRRELWARFSFALGRYPDIRDFCNWLNEQATFIRLVSSERTDESLQQAQEPGSSKKKLNCCVCQGEHSLFKCSKFKLLSVDERWNTVKKFKLCSGCFRTGHTPKDCKFKQQCNINNCQKFHCKLLHNTPRSPPQDLNDASEVGVCFHETKVENLLMKIIPIKVYNNDLVIETFALIDEGSKLSLVDSSLLDELNLDLADIQEESLRIKWYGKQYKTEKSKTISLEISGEHNQTYTLDNIKTIENIDLPKQSISAKNLPEKYGTFRDLPVDYTNAKPRILLGLSHSSFGFAKEAEEKDGLIASNTKLGWIIHGSMQSNKDNSKPNTLCLLLDHKEENLHELVKNYINSDNLGIENIDDDSNDENSRSLRLLESTTKRISGSNKFETGLLWKQDNIKLPNNFNNAYRRLILTEKRMAKDPEFAKKYEENLMAYVSKGYARRLAKCELNDFPGRQWYLPHFVTLNVNKPKKFRIVFDAASKFEGMSLNSQLMKGPDLNQPLLKVLLNFRIGRFAVCADIKEMFNQVNIRKEDQHCQRFLWRHGDTSKPLETYIMTAMLFGAACSPCSAQYVKNINAMEYLQTDKEAAEAILEQHYVDDFVMSFESEQQAIRITKNVRKIHEKGGFLLTKFVSNSNKILKGLGEIIPEDELSLNKESDDPEKILGLCWNRSKDSFIFKSKLDRIPADILDNTRKPSKREVLKIAMSIYDPFGFLLYFTISCKILLQEIWKAKTDWDEQINDKHFVIYKNWQNRLRNISEIQIPRYYFPGTVEMGSVHLHIFTDASASAYCAVGYIRSEHQGKYNVSYLMGKAKVAPINKSSSIPRLELQGALLGCKLRKIILENLKIKIDSTTFWCDSQCVLHWINSKNNDFKIFVSNRIKFIQENSKGCKWRYINTKFNVADCATKIKDIDKIPKNNHVWITGPEFLTKPETEWNEVENYKKSIIDPNLLESRNFDSAPVNVIHTQELLIKIEDHSSYYHLRKLVGWILRAKNNFLAGGRNRGAKILSSYLKFQEWTESDIFLCKQAQQDSFSSELQSLAKDNKVQGTSSIKKLCPYLDDRGVLRVYGRLDLVESMSYSRRRPIILSKDHPLSFLIAKDYHETFKHQNNKLVMNEIRMKFWIVNIKSLLDKVIRSCQHCRMEKLKFDPPIMAPLPEDRTTLYVKPFSYCGIDYCGPYSVKIKRSVEKRWIVIFNCLTTRAVHLEVVQRLTTDNCLLSINNFMNRRGTPIRIRSDNATYFTSSNRVIARIFQSDQIQRQMNSKGIQWLLNCPETPHVGGVWERLVQCVKKIVGKALSTYLLTVDVFNSVVIETEGMVNSRPLLDLPTEPEEEEPLTPNHFLMGTSLYHQTPVLNDNEIKLCKLNKQFRMLNSIKTAIWNRWENEYLIQLIPRQKWFSKTDPPKENDIVIFQTQNKWVKGIITKLYLSKDDVVRYVDIKTTNTKEIKRAVHNLKIFRST